MLEHMCRDDGYQPNWIDTQNRIVQRMTWGGDLKAATTTALLALKERLPLYHLYMWLGYNTPQWKLAPLTCYVWHFIETGVIGNNGWIRWKWITFRSVTPRFDHLIPYIEEHKRAHKKGPPKVWFGRTTWTHVKNIQLQQLDVCLIYICLNEYTYFSRV